MGKTLRNKELEVIQESHRRMLKIKVKSSYKDDYFQNDP